METGIEHDSSATELLSQKFSAIIVEYVTKVSSRYRGNEFTSSQLAKTILTRAEIGSTRFPIVHRIVKDILAAWEAQGLCDHIATTKYSRCRKTKDTFRFTKKGLTEIKKQAIEETIRVIKENELTTTPIMRTRDYIIRDTLEELLNSATRSPQPAADKEA
jgi:hypothetical protein